MDNIKIIESLFDEKKIKILRLFLNDKERQFYLREVAMRAKVSPATTYRVLNKLIKLEIIRQIKINKFKLYKLADNEIVPFLESFLKEGKRILDYFVSEVSALEGVESVILHGKETEDKANVLVIGEGIDANALKRISAEIKEKYNFTVSSLTLAKEQYEQMSKMGLYQGKKKILK